ncbi:MAG: cell division ATPase MinD [Candidatus Micrarchaeia archaeon]|jgi:septum site-determining protein MinD
MTSIVVSSGKGGVGKTSLAVNLGIVLAQAGKKTVVVDADIAMASVGIMLGIERAPISLHNVLMGEVEVKDAVYEGPKGLKYVPSSLSLERLKKVEYEKLRTAIAELETENDFVIIDSPPGLSQDALAAIRSAKEMIMVVTPEPASLADALKIKSVAERNNVKIIGLVMNFVTHDKSEIKRQDLETLLGLRVIAEIPEDLEARRSAALQQPVVLRAPESDFAHGVLDVAGALHGVELKVEAKPKKKSVFSGIAAALASLFKKKKE